MADRLYDVIVVGAGPAGLSAALVLGRCRRSVLLCDAGKPRNYAATALHGFLSRDGIHPQELRAIACQQLRPYSSVETCELEIVDAVPGQGQFEVVGKDGSRWHSRKLILATGLEDEAPPVPGFFDFYGRGIHHCPYCDGWEVRDEALVALGSGAQGVGLAEELTVWSRSVTLCTNGVPLPLENRGRLTKLGIEVYEDQIVRFQGEGRLESLVFAGGAELSCRAVFFGSGQQQASRIAESLGCELTEEGVVPCGEAGETSVAGLYIVGDASRRLPVHFVVVAAAEGAEAAAKINQLLLEEDLARL